jgi:HEAT repeat protein
MERKNVTAGNCFWFLVSYFLFFCSTPLLQAEEKVIDLPMYHDPELPRARVAYVFPDHILDSWLMVLSRPEADYEYRAALTIALAHKDGLKGTDSAIDPLVQALTGPGKKGIVRLAAAQALIELDARGTAAQLLEQAQAGDQDLRDVVEPALARWSYEPAAKIWLERLGRPDTPRGDLILAMRGLAALRNHEAATLLAGWVHSFQVPWSIRLEAAQSLGTIKTIGLEEDARRLGAQIVPAGMSGRLASAWLLRHHQGKEAVELLQNLSHDSEPAVASVALARLLEIDPNLLLPAVKEVLASSDAQVRSFGVEALFREATLERLRLLADRLDDSHPDVRNKARRALHDLAAKPNLREAVIEQGVHVLAGQDWRGLEQAIILLGQLKHKPAAERLVALLNFERPEVSIAAAWGLRQLAVPETLPRTLDHFLSLVRLSAANQKSRRPQILPTPVWDQQLCQLALFMGQSLYRPAEQAFREQVPRRRGPADGEPLIGQETRAASIWALGKLHEGKVDPQLARQLEERVKDIPKRMDPGENPHVRWMSAITLGRMKSKGSLNTLERFHLKFPTLDPVSHACGWSIQQITGQAPPAPGTVEFPAGTFKNWLRSVPEAKPAG